MAWVLIAVSALLVAAAACAVSEAGISSDGAGGDEDEGTASSAAGGNAAVPSPNAAISFSIRSNAALNAPKGLIDAICPQPASMALAWESIRSQIRPSVPISRHRHAISRMTRAPLRTG